MPLTILMYGDSTSYNGQIRENVGLERCRISEVSLYHIDSDHSSDTTVDFFITTPCNQAHVLLLQYYYHATVFVK